MANKTRLNRLHICGPGLSVCCSVISVWGIIMLAIVGGLMLANSAAFIEDIPMEEGLSGANYTEALHEGYKHAATNCFGAVAMYGGCLVFCLIQVWFNVKLSEQNQIK